MKFKSFHKIALLPVFIALLMGCNSCKNCQKEYEQLSTTEFHSLQEADSTIGVFLSKFDGKKKCVEYCDKVKQMGEEFNTMSNKFSAIDNSLPKKQYCAFISMVNTNDNTFSTSSFNAVKKTWDYLVTEKKETYMRERFDLIDEDELGDHLMEYAIKVANRVGDNWRVIKDGCYIINNDIEIERDVENKVVKGNCTVCVLMEKRMPWWWEFVGGVIEIFFPRVGNIVAHVVETFGRNVSAAVMIEVEGALEVSESSCNVDFSRGKFGFGDSNGENYGNFNRGHRNIRF